MSSKLLFGWLGIAFLTVAASFIFCAANTPATLSSGRLSENAVAESGAAAAAEKTKSTLATARDDAQTFENKTIFILIAIASLVALCAGIYLGSSVFKPIRRLKKSALNFGGDAEGKADGIFGSSGDIAERRRNEETLRESEARYRVITESASDAIVTIDEGQTILFVNSAAEKIFGYSVDEMLGNKLFMLIPEHLRDAHAAGMKRYIETNERRISWQGVELSAMHKNGHEVPIEVTFGEIENDGKRLFTGIMRDITERRRAKEEVQKNLSLLASTFEATADGILVVDRSNRIVTYNQRFVEMWQIPDEIINSRDNAKAVNYVLEQLSNAEDYAITTDYLTANPEDKHLDLVKFKDERIYERYSHPQMLDGKVIGRVVSFRDITERKRAEELILQSEEKYRNILETIEEGYFETDLEGVFTFYNEALGDVLGYDTDELLGMHYRHYVDHRNAKKLFTSYVKVYRTGQPLSDFNWEVIGKDGNRRFLESSITLMRNAAGGAVGFRGLVRDVTGRKQTEEALRESEYKLRTLLESMHEGLLQVDKQDGIIYVNDRFCEMVGYTSAEMLGTNWSRLIFDDDGDDFIKQVNKRRYEGISDSYEVCLRTKSNEMLWVIVGGAPTVDAAGAVTGSIGVFTDITERKRAEERLRYDALHDGLTDLANRTLFNDHLQMTIERAKRDRSELFAVLFLDFDRFKVINDSLGHAEGDNLLKQIARRLESSLRSGDLVARLGGDEFTVLINKLSDSSDAVRVAERIQKNLETPFETGGGEIYISASIGIALSTTGHERAEDMMRDADIAMYRAKAKGKARHQVFDQAMHEQALSQLRIETELRQAFEQKEFCLHYQPIYSLDTDQTVGFESLVRWHHPQFGMIPPNDFIPIAEENGLIIPIGQWILQESCRQMREWQIANPSAASLIISVNLSFKQFLQPDLADQVAATLEKTGLAAKCLKLEITESHVMENSQKAVMMMNRLCALGVELSLDDFGTGYSSLSHLHRLPVTYLKIDRSFVSRMIECEENGEIVYTIKKLAQNLKMKVVAEGIETVEQLNYLKNLNCEFGQGYYFSKPLEADAAKRFVGENIETPPLLLKQPVISAELNM